MSRHPSLYYNPSLSSESIKKLLNSFYFTLSSWLVVYRHSLSSSFNRQDCTCISQIGYIANSLVSFLSHIGQTAGCPSVAGAYQLQLIIRLAENSRDDCFDVDIILFFINFLLEDLFFGASTFGMTLAQYSETWGPPCPSKIPKSPEPSPLKSSIEM